MVGLLPLLNYVTLPRLPNASSLRAILVRSWCGSVVAWSIAHS